MLRVFPVGAEGLGEFIDLSQSLHAADPLWVPPIRASLEAELSGRSHFSTYGRLQMFLAQVDGRTVGRIAGVVNARLLDASGAPVGQLGYYECVDDIAVARALIDAGLDWLRAEGAREALAPMNGGAQRLHRFMVRGFDTEPFLFEPRNAPYYPSQFEACGFSPGHRWQSYEVPRSVASALHAQLTHVLTRRPPKGAIELLEPRELAATLGRLHPLLDGLWSGHIGYASLEAPEMAEGFAAILPLMTSRNIGVYVENARDLGCAFFYPDYVAEVRALAGDASGWGSWVGRGLPRRVIMHTLAVVPEARVGGGALQLLHRGLQHVVEDGYEEVIVALVSDELRFFGHKLDANREYKLFQRKLA